MIFTPILPEIMDSVYEKTGLIEGEDEDVDIIIADKASGLYFACFALGTIVAPPVGSVIYELLHEDWAYTCDVIGVTAAIFTMVYLFFNLLPDLKKEREGHEKMEKRWEGRGHAGEVPVKQGAGAGCIWKSTSTRTGWCSCPCCCPTACTRRH